jgi:acetyl esterase
MMMRPRSNPLNISSWQFTLLLLASIHLIEAQQTPAKSPNSITYENVPYGDHPQQIIDFWQAKVEDPAPLILFIHGGGFTGGSHDKINQGFLEACLGAGMHFASIEYRLLQHAWFPAAHHDCVRALQFLRSKASQWGIDPNRIGGFGGSAGAQLVAYLAWSPDFADPSSNDSIAHESSRLKAVGLIGGQANLDFDWWVENIPGYQKDFHSKQIPEHLSPIDVRALMHELSIENHISSDDPPSFMSYGMAPNDPIPNEPRAARGWSIHHVNFGLSMQTLLEKHGVEHILKYPGTEQAHENAVDFLIHHLKK